MTTIRRHAFCALAAALCLPAAAHGSGFMEEEDPLGPQDQPDTISDFAGGKLGILSGALSSRWRAIAFRVLTGPPLDAKTRSALGGSIDDKPMTPVAEWLAARAKQGAGPVAKPDARYYDFTNCYADSFATATKTLGERARRFGAQSREVKEWLSAQDQVFINCDADTPAIPPDKVPPGVDGAIQKDRDYQVAAAWFYARKFDDARKAFERVATDRDSPWAGYGRFVVARAMLRQATAAEKADLALLDQAEKRLSAVLADPKAAPLHASARRLVRFVAYRTRPDRQLLALADVLAKGNDDDLDLILTDFVWLLGKQWESLKPADLEPYQKSELIEWTLAWQLGDADRAARALARYHERKTVPWLLMALASLPPDHAEAKALLDEARQVKAGTPGYLTAAFHRARLLLGQKRVPAARALLDEALAGKELPRDAKNSLTEARYTIARSLDEALAFMPRLSRGGSATFPPAVNDIFLQYLPIAESGRAAEDPRLPDSLRKLILRAAWMRAALLDQVDLARALGPKLAAVDPELKTLVEEWAAAPGAPDRRYALVHAWLRHSEWELYLTGTASACASSSPILKPAEGRPAPVPPAFVEGALLARARAESERLDKLVGNPATFRALQVEAWAVGHPADPRVPEDLHRAVNGTKHACDGETATAASKRAFKTLHKIFPSSEWTKKTKYYYP